MLTHCQNNFFDKSIKHEKVISTISSPREYEFINYLTELGYKLGIDFIHQFACAQEEMGLLFVADFAFPKEKLIIELDGVDHQERKQRDKDYLRDKVFFANKFTVVRIKTPMSNYDKSFYRNIIKDFINLHRYGTDKTNEMGECVSIFEDSGEVKTTNLS